MKLTKKQLKEIQQVEKKVAKVCDSNDSVIDEITGIAYPKKTIEVTKNDKGVVVNKETGQPHFSELEKPLSEKQTYRDVSVNLSFGKNSPHLKIQLKKQGFKLDKEYINIAEHIRTDLFALKRVGILSEKQLIKCFKKLSMEISKKAIESIIKDDEVAVHQKTTLNS